MTEEAFRDALTKGMGRPALALQRGDPALYREAILDACVENLQWDRQCEENRAEYVMRLVDLAGLREAALDRILATLPQAEEEWDRDWMVDLLEELARTDDRARAALFALARSGYERAQDNLAEVDDEALRWLAENVVPTMSPEDRWRIGMWLPDDEAEDLTPTQKGLRLIYEEARKARTSAKNRPIRGRGLASVWQCLQRGKRPKISTREFVEVATKADRRRAARILLTTRSESAAGWIARTFRRVDCPLSVSALIRHMAHPAHGLAVCSLLGEISSPRIRRAALRMIRTKALPWGTLDALTSSFQPDDEGAILQSVERAVNPSKSQLDAFILDLNALLRKYPAVDWQPHAEWIYENSPCSFCRSSAVDWMVEHGRLPDAIREEAVYDAETDTREAVSSAQSRP